MLKNNPTLEEIKRAIGNFSRAIMRLGEAQKLKNNMPTPLSICYGSEGKKVIYLYPEIDEEIIATIITAIKTDARKDIEKTKNVLVEMGVTGVVE